MMGSRRRTMTPPGPPLVTRAISPFSGRAQSRPIQNTRSVSAVCSAIGMNAAGPVKDWTP